MSDNKAKILAALERGDFMVECWLPENEEVCEVERDGTIYEVDPTQDRECIAGCCNNGGCTVTVCGLEFNGFNGRQVDEFVGWQCDDEELEEDEDIVDALDLYVALYSKIGGDAIKDFCARYTGKSREELKSFLLGLDEMPDGDE